jgi:hypothetical protein
VEAHVGSLATTRRCDRGFTERMSVRQPSERERWAAVGRSLE